MNAPRSTPDIYGKSLAGAKVLVIDDEPGMRHFLVKTLETRVKRVDAVGSPAQATKALDEAQYDLVILDNLMPGGTGLDWLTEQKRKGFFADAILITAYADLETAIAALRAGVSDFVLKPFRANQILSAVARTLDRKYLQRDNTLLRRELSSGQGHGKLLGNSEPMEDVRAMLARLAPLPTPVLITGARRTGRELAARPQQDLSARAEAPFVPVNCATILPERFAEELFGVVEAEERVKPGLLLLADGGTLLLDEIAQMPETVQAALLRVLEDKKVRPVGAEREIPLNVRFLFATNDDIEASVAAGRFRADLYHRIHVVKIDMPPLKDRMDDIVELAAHFMAQYSASLAMPSLELDEEPLLKLRRYDWPGNVRELRNMIERSVILGAFPEEFAGEGTVTGAQAIENLELVVQRHILRMVDLCDGNRAEAARRLGVSRKTIDRRMAAWSE